MSTILCIDAGNTRIKWQVRHGGRILAGGVTPTSIPSLDVPRSVAALVHASAVSAVASRAAVERLKKILDAQRLPPLIELASQATWQNLRIGYEVPARMGVDRWLAIVSAAASTPLPLVVVDAGTAITVDPVDARGQHLGGFIVLGLRAMLSGLGSATAGIDVHELNDVPHMPATRNTREAVVAGAVESARGLIARAVQMLEARDGSQPATVVVTGGDGPVLCAGSAAYHWRRDLVLAGIEIVARSALDGTD